MPKREIPNNKEAEMSVLGATFLDRNALVKVCESVTEDMFYYEAHQKIFVSIKSLFDNKIPLDITTLKEELDRKKYFNSIGGLEYLSEIIDSVATTANLDYYIKIIKDKAGYRALIDAATDIITKSYEDERGDISGAFDNAERTILNITKTRQSSEFKPIKEVLALAKEKLEDLSKNKHAVTGIETGFPDLDKVTSGLHAGELIILAARPGMGKTAFALNIGVNGGMTTKQAIAIFTLEMPAEQLVSRMISSTGSIDSYKLQTGNMQHNDWKKYNEAMSQLSDTNIYIEDNASITISEIKAKCRRLANQDEGLGLVIIDYLQLVTTGGRTESRQQEVAEISRTLKTMAMELRVPVIALAQLSRNAERRENNEPMLTDLRESGQIEQDADLVMFINRKDYFKTKEEINKEKSVPVDIIIAKHRKGATGKFKLTFELNMSNFKNYLGSIEEDE